MVFHAEGLAEIELHYATSGAFSQSNALKHQAVITFLLSAKSALHAIDEPPDGVLSSPCYNYFYVAMHTAPLIVATSLQATPSQCMLGLWLYYMCTETLPRPQEMCLQ